MAQCSYCQSETELYWANSPICLLCSEKREAKRKPPTQTPDIHSILYQEVIAATSRANSASEDFHSVMKDIPSGIPHPDGKQRIHNASRRLSVARKDVVKAYSRFNDFLTHGIVPEDLKRSG